MYAVPTERAWKDYSNHTKYAQPPNIDLIRNEVTIDWSRNTQTMQVLYTEYGLTQVSCPTIR